MFGIAGTAELSTFCPGTGTWNRLQDGKIARVVGRKVGGFSSQEVACFLWGLAPPQAGNSAQQQQLVGSEGEGTVQHQQQQEKREQLIQQHQQGQQQQEQQLLQQLCHLSLSHLLLQPMPKLNPVQLRMSLLAATALCYTLPRYLLQPAFQLLLQSASHCYSYVPSDVCYTLLLLARAGYKPVAAAGEQQQLLELLYEQLSGVNSNSSSGAAGRAEGAAGITTRVLCMQGELLWQWGLRPGSVWAAAYREAAEQLLPKMGDVEQRCVLGSLLGCSRGLWGMVWYQQQQQQQQEVQQEGMGQGQQEEPGAGGNGAGASEGRGLIILAGEAARAVIGQGRVG